MQHKTNDLARFLEIKHRYWGLITSMIQKTNYQQIKMLFKSDQKVYLFKSFDQGSEA